MENMITVLYIAPASGDTHHPQARIYSSVFDRELFLDCKLGVRDMYRLSPHRWTECGLINYQGRLICFDGSAEQLHALQDAEPLAAGLVFTFTFTFTNANERSAP